MGCVSLHAHARGTASLRRRHAAPRPFGARAQCHGCLLLLARVVIHPARQYPTLTGLLGRPGRLRLLSLRRDHGGPPAWTVQPAAARIKIAVECCARGTVAGRGHSYGSQTPLPKGLAPPVSLHTRLALLADGASHLDHSCLSTAGRQRGKRARRASRRRFGSAVAVPREQANGQAHTGTAHPRGEPCSVALCRIMQRQSMLL